MTAGAGQGTDREVNGSMGQPTSYYDTIDAGKLLFERSVLATIIEITRTNERTIIIYDAGSKFRFAR